VTDNKFTSGTAGREDRGKTSITIVGIGNEFRGDDGVALFTLRDLKDTLPPQVKIVEMTGDQSNLLELMQDTNNMIIIDAVNSTAPSGTILHINASEEPFPHNFFAISSHGIDLAQSIELARTMKKLPSVVLIYGIVGRDFSFTTSLSQQVKDSAEMVKNKIVNDVDRMLKSEN
jgi:hydrogenase maturation protease